MKTTRRNLLRFIGLGAAAAALAPAVSAETASAAVTDCPICGDVFFSSDAVLSAHVLAEHYSDPSLITVPLHVKQVAEFEQNRASFNERVRMAYGKWLETPDGQAYLMDRVHEYTGTITLPSQLSVSAIAQARADGYNRGREVEMARAESRQARGALTLDEFDAAWSALGGVVSGEMGSGPVVKD